MSTGAAPGIDQAGAEAALNSGGSVRLVLPWSKYEADWVTSMQEEHGVSRVQVIVYNPAWTSWQESVRRFHPHPEALSEAAMKLHARNFGIVEWVDLVIAMPRSLAALGGTGQGMRIAVSRGTPVLTSMDEIDHWIKAHDFSTR